MTESIIGECIKIDYQADEGAFAVIQIQNAQGKFSAVGSLGHVIPGQSLSLTGKWKFHPSYGEQLEVESILIDSPKSQKGIALYLSAQIEGIGIGKAKQIVEYFGIATIDILNTSPLRLKEVPGIGPKTARKIAEQWNNDVKMRELHITLRSFDISVQLCMKLVEKYGDDALSMVTKYPYQLSQELKGVGFKTADKIAQKLGIPPTSPERTKAAIVHVFRMQETMGHCSLIAEQLLKEVCKLEVEEGNLWQSLQRMVENKELIVIEEDSTERYYRPQMFYVEKNVAHRILEVAAQATQLSFLDAQCNIEQWEKQLSIKLNLQQKQAVHMVFNNFFSIVTGGPGTGKTTIIKVLLEEAKARGEKWLLAAPTGRAAKRMTESTLSPAQTIHRLLGYNGFPKEFDHNEHKPLMAQAVLIDEASMLDIWLTKSLLSAIPKNCRVILVGDVDQLPSVGPGQVLHDLIASQTIPVTKLTEVYRQAQDSNIIRNAHAINHGILPISTESDPNAGSLKDFFILDRSTPEETIQTILTVVKNKIPALGFHPMTDLQILTPTHSGLLGTQNLNQVLQELLNPKGKELKTNNKRFRQGDRVLQTKNDYDNNIFNGDVGFILTVADEMLTVQFDEEIVMLSGAQINDLELAYAVSVHKSQGSEYPAVLTIIHKAHWIMLRRNLLYTAITRAKKFCCLIGSQWAMGIATKQEEMDERQTGLKRCLIEAHAIQISNIN